MANRQTIAELLVELQAKTDGFNRKMSGAEKRTQTADRRIGKATKSIKNRFAGITKVLGKMNGAIAAIGAAIATAGLARVGKKALEGADDLQSAADALGISAETLQAVQFKLQEAADISPDKVLKGLERFNKRLGEARTGTGALSDTIEDLGISLVDTEGYFKSTEEVLNEVTSAIANAGDQAARAEITSAAFGRELAGATKGFAGIGDDIDGVIRRAMELGRVVENDVIAKAAAANDAWQRTTRNLKASFNAGLLEGFTEGLNEADVDMKSLAKLARDVGRAVGEAMAKMVELVDKVAAIFERVKALADAISFDGDRGSPQERSRIRRPNGPGPAPGSGSAPDDGLRVTIPMPRNSLLPPSRRPGASPSGSPAAPGIPRVPASPSEGDLDDVTRGPATFDTGFRGFETINSFQYQFKQRVDEYFNAIGRGNEEIDALNSNLEQSDRLADRLGFSFSSAFEEAVIQGNGLRGVLQGLAEDIQRIVVRQTVSQPLANAISGAVTGIGGALAGGVINSGFQPSGVVGGAEFGTTTRFMGGGGTVGFASGGSFRVGGPAGMDNKLVSFKASPGEMVNVSRPGEGGGDTIVTNNYSIDARGADQGVVQRLEGVMEEHVRNHDQHVAKGVKRSRSERVLGRRG